MDEDELLTLDLNVPPPAQFDGSNPLKPIETELDIPTDDCKDPGSGSNDDNEEDNFCSANSERDFAEPETQPIESEYGEEKEPTGIESESVVQPSNDPEVETIVSIEESTVHTVTNISPIFTLDNIELTPIEQIHHKGNPKYDLINNNSDFDDDFVITNQQPEILQSTPLDFIPKYEKKESDIVFGWWPTENKWYRGKLIGRNDKKEWVVSYSDGDIWSENSDEELIAVNDSMFCFLKEMYSSKISENCILNAIRLNKGDLSSAMDYCVASRLEKPKKSPQKSRSTPSKKRKRKSDSVKN